MRCLGFFRGRCTPPRNYTRKQNSRNFFSAFLKLFQIFKKQNVYEPNFATPNFFCPFFWVRLVGGVQIFEPVGKKLLGRHALGGDFGGLSSYLGFFGFEFGDLVKKNTEKQNGEQAKKEEKVDCLQKANPVLPQGKGPLGGTLARIFSAHFWSCSRFSRNKTFMSRTLQLPFFHVSRKRCEKVLSKKVFILTKAR